MIISGRLIVHAPVEKGAAATAAIKLVKQLKGVITDLTRADVQGLQVRGNIIGHARNNM